ncbi:MAG: glycerophosphodiester phosphodiesterase family protein, partial [Acutalibacteraceae bacterium]
MNRYRKLLFSFLTVTVAALIFGVSAFAADETAYDKIISDDGIISVSHRGNTASFPENSLEAVESAQQIGADLISVSVGKTSDGVLVLCDTSVPLSDISNCGISDVGKVSYTELSKLRLYHNDGTLSDCGFATLEEAINSLDKSLLILDNSWDYRDEIYASVKKSGKQKLVIIRTDASSKKIAEWTKENPGLFVIGIYKSNIVFNAISHFNRLFESGQPLVQYQSKNYFNVSFNSSVTRLFSGKYATRALIPMYSPDLCGQREDNCVGWDEMIERGFSAIETNCIQSLVNYIESREKARDSLSALIERAESADTALFSSVSAKNLRSALSKAQAVISDTRCSLGEAEKAFSLLNESMNNLTFHLSGDVQKGSLNVTAGKIIAVVLVGAAL